MCTQQTNNMTTALLQPSSSSSSAPPKKRKLPDWIAPAPLGGRAGEESCTRKRQEVTATTTAATATAAATTTTDMMHIRDKAAAAAGHEDDVFFDEAEMELLVHQFQKCIDTIDAFYYEPVEVVLSEMSMAFTEEERGFADVMSLACEILGIRYECLDVGEGLIFMPLSCEIVTLRRYFESAASKLSTLLQK